MTGPSALSQTTKGRAQREGRSETTIVPLPCQSPTTQAAASLRLRPAYEVRLLRSTGITPLPRYYEPVRLPAAADAALWIPPRRCASTRPHHAGSPRTLDDSVDARPPQSSRTARWVRLLVASPSMAGFVTSARVAAVTGLTRPNRVRVRWAHVFAVR